MSPLIYIILVKSVTVMIRAGRRPSGVWVKLMARGSFALNLLLVLSATVVSAGAQTSPWPNIARQVSELLERAAKAYEAKDTEKARDLVSEAYFGPFEEQGMEVAIRREISARRARELEKMFNEIRQAMGSGEGAGRVRERIRALEQALDEDARELVRLGVAEVRAAEKEALPIAEGQTRSPVVAPEGLLREIGARLDEAFARYQADDLDQAKALLGSAYFDLFESRGLEVAIGARSPQRKAEIEAAFARIRSEIGSRASIAKVGQDLEVLKGQIQEAADLVKQGRGRWGSFLNGLIIIVREGFEAILIITALTAYLLKSGHADKVRVIYQASGVALLGSLLTAVVIQTLFRINPRHQETLEGMTMLLATAVLFYVSYWLTSKAETERWQRYIRQKVQSSLGKGSLAALWCAAFLAVYREGAEIVLFYQALLAGTDPGEAGTVLGGLGAGALALILIFFLLRSGSVHIPIRAFFTVTSALLYYLAFIFAGRGIRELQESGLVGITPASWMPSWDILGLYPTWESLGIQILLVVAATFALTYLFLIRGRRAKAEAA